MAKLKPAVFLDRDGVINEDRADYVKSWKEFRFIQGARAALGRLRQARLPVVVITNQSAVGRGLLTRAGLEEIHRKMVRAVEQAGGRIRAVHYCPHHPDEKCGCRKPRAGLLRQAAVDLKIDLQKSIMIGDTEKDLQAGRKAGCLTVLVLTGQGRETLSRLFSKGERSLPDFICPDLKSAIEVLSRWAPHKKGP